MASLAHEFVTRYWQLMADGKTHGKAVKLTTEEFINQFETETTVPPTLFFLDKSGCDYTDNGWETFGFI